LLFLAYQVVNRAISIVPQFKLNIKRHRPAWADTGPGISFLAPVEADYD